MSTIEDKNYDSVKTPDMIAELTDLASKKGNSKEIEKLTYKVRERINCLRNNHV